MVCCHHSCRITTTRSKCFLLPALSLCLHLCSHLDSCRFMFPVHDYSLAAILLPKVTYCFTEKQRGRLDSQHSSGLFCEPHCQPQDNPAERHLHTHMHPCVTVSAGATVPSFRFRLFTARPWRAPKSQTCMSSTEDQHRRKGMRRRRGRRCMCQLRQRRGSRKGRKRRRKRKSCRIPLWHQWFFWLWPKPAHPVPGVFELSATHILHAGSAPEALWTCVCVCVCACEHASVYNVRETLSI